ncbi:MAG: hypothetical protein GYB39_07585 [Algicola sp.]|nr:hypothetical protein [Algicola sp.]
MKNYILLIFLSISLLISCSNNERKLLINDFSKKITDTLVPQESKSYGAAGYVIKGISNDTILMTFYGIKKKFTGSFEYKFRLDYYGGSDVEFEFNPYRASQGEIEISYGLY